MTRGLLFFVLLSSLASAEFARTREATEWSVATWYNANDEKRPRVLLIGDSIVRGYESGVQIALAGKANVGFWATSKCVTDPTYVDHLNLLLDEYPSAVIQFNNGLHSLGTDPVEWEKGLRRALEAIVKRGRGAKILVATSTPLRDPNQTEKVKALNRILMGIAEEKRLPVNDLFALMDPLDRKSMWVDNYHYNGEGKKIQAEQVAARISELLGGPAASAVEARAALASAASDTGPEGRIGVVALAASAVVNGDFEKPGSWSVYPSRPEAGSIEFSKERPRSGAGCVKIVANVPLQLYQPRPVLEPSTAYRLRYGIRGESPAEVQAFVRTTKPPYVFHGDHKAVASTEWREVTVDFTTSADWSKEERTLIFQFPKGTTCWIDDVRIEKR